MGLYVGGKVGPIGYSKSITGGGGGRTARREPTTPEEAEFLGLILGSIALIGVIAGGIGYLIDGGSGAQQGVFWVIAGVIIITALGYALMLVGQILVVAWHILRPGVLLVGWMYRSTVTLVRWVRAKREVAAASKALLNDLK